MVKIENIVQELVLTEDKNEKKKLAKTIFEAAYEKGV